MAANRNVGGDSTDSRAGATDGAERPILAYLTCFTDAARHYIGAVLLTDSKGRPLEFLCSDPVSPSVVQRILWGAGLDRTVRIEVLGCRLLNALSKHPDLILVQHEEMLPLSSYFEMPVACLFKPTTPTDAPTLSSIVYKTNGDAAVNERVGSMVGELEHQMDLLEPFARIPEAVKAVHAARQKDGRQS